MLSASAVLCDMDGTLVDSTAVVEGVWAEFADRYGVELGELLATSHGRKTVETVQEYATPDMDVAAVVRELEAMELTRMEGIVEIPGARAFIESLEAVDKQRWALVTSAPRDLAAQRMAAVGMAMPSTNVCAEDVSKGKPDPQGYLMAAAALQVDPRDVVVLEGAEAGIKAALAAGCQVVVVGGLESPVTTGLYQVPDLRSLVCTRVPAATSGHLLQLSKR